jgi:hypothetical protein
VGTATPAIEVSMLEIKSEVVSAFFFTMGAFNIYPSRAAMFMAFRGYRYTVFMV